MNVVGGVLAEHFVCVLTGAIAAVEEKVISGEIRTPAPQSGLTKRSSMHESGEQRKIARMV